MRLLDLVHRWTGGLVGLALALLGLSGAILAHKDSWIGVPHARDALVIDSAATARIAERFMADPEGRPRAIVFASDTLGVHRINYAGGAGAFASQSGDVVSRWDNQWQRPEAWLFDFHHHLFAGDTGEAVAGILGLLGIGFVGTGAILWWRTRKSFAFRLWPARMSRPAIVRQHRDLGVVAAPLLLVSFITGAYMLFGPRPAAFKPPAPIEAEVADRLDWAGMIAEAHRRFPDAQPRMLSLPRGDGLITLRLRQPGEWTPNGRTMLWFAADTGRLIEARDINAAPASARLYAKLLPVHNGAVGGLPWKLAMTFSGLALTLLGTLAVWTFWFRRPRDRRSTEDAELALA